MNPVRTEIYRLGEEADAIAGVLLDDEDCAFNLYGGWSEASARRIADCAERRGSGIAVIGDSHAVDVFNGMYLNLPGRFLVGFTSSCQPDTPRTDCPYEGFEAFAADHPEAFDTIIYVQAAYQLFETADGMTGREIFERLPETHPVEAEAYRIQTERIESALAYLEALPEQARVIWVGPRIEPHISRNFILSRGCTHRYRLRPGLRSLFEELDATVAAEARQRAIDYVSQIDTTALDMETDFIDCDGFYWRDGDHWSLEGAGMFVERMLANPTLEPLAEAGGTGQPSPAAGPDQPMPTGSPSRAGGGPSGRRASTGGGASRPGQMNTAMM